MPKPSEQAMSNARQRRPVMLDAYECWLLLAFLEFVLVGSWRDGSPAITQYDFTDDDRNHARSIREQINKASNG